MKLTKSIFIDPIELHHSAKENVSILATELGVCEKYLTMGYNYSNGQNILERTDYLEYEIVRQEERMKRGL